MVGNTFIRDRDEDAETLKLLGTLQQEIIGIGNGQQDFNIDKKLSVLSGLPAPRGI